MSKTTHGSKSFEQLFVEQSQGLIHFLRKKLKHSEDAEDIAQNAFIRIQKLSSLTEIENPKAYLYQTASNLAVDQLRREKLHQNYVNRAPIESDVESAQISYIGNSDGINPERVLSSRYELTAVKAAISKLPPKPRQAFLLHRIKGMSYYDIALEMGVSVSSVEKYILIALKQSRQSLGNDSDYS